MFRLPFPIDSNLVPLPGHDYIDVCLQYKPGSILAHSTRRALQFDRFRFFHGAGYRYPVSPAEWNLERNVWALPKRTYRDIEDLPVGIRVVAGIFQSTAVRAAGFGIVPLNSLAPAVKVLYVVMRKSNARMLFMSDKTLMSSADSRPIVEYISV